jgi:transketolase
MQGFGASAPANELYKNFGIDKDNIINKIKEKL